jgi:tetratricopeptide (TPR) repeat protein
MMLRIATRTVLFVVLFTSIAVNRVSAEDSLDSARQLYAAAAYDEALAMLDRLHGLSEAAAPELEQERALCLLALNRLQDAEKAIAVVVQSNPLYIPDASTVSPRVRTTFQDVRGRLVPDIVRASFGRARTSFAQKEYAQAITGLDVVLALTSNLPAAIPDKSEMDDLRVLAEGFKTLSEAALAPPPAPAALPEEESDVARVFDATVPGVQPPVVIKQEVPEWRPSMGKPPTTAGLINVTIDERGTVERVDVIHSLNPSYDSLLVAATQKWSYVPASHEGVKVKFRKAIRLTLR